MRSEVMGKTMAMFMVIAMIVTGIAMLPVGVQAATQAYTIEGKVLNNVGDVPLEGVTVIIDVTNASKNETVSTGVDGTFSKVFMLDDSYNFTIYFEMVGFGNESRTFNTTWFGNTTTADTDITLLYPQDVIQGTVFELDSTNPIEGVDVTIGSDTITTDKDGFFNTFTSDNTVDLYFNMNGYYSSSSMDVSVAGISADDIYYMEKITPNPTIEVSGVVYGTDLTDGISGALVSISEGDDKWITAVCDSDGYYTMMAYPGNYQIKASADTYLTTFDESYFFTVSNDKSSREDVQLIAIGTQNVGVLGWVNNSAGAPIDAADVKLHRTDGKYVAETTTNATGFYALNITAGSFIMEVSEASYFTDATTSVAAAGFYNVILTEKSMNFTLSGFVFDMDDDSAIEDASVTIYSKNFLFSESVMTGDNGYYEFDVSTYSDYMVVVDADGYQSELKDADEYQSELMDADSIIDDRYVGFDLYPSGEDIMLTKYTFNGWNTIQVETFKTMNVDNVTARHNADRKFGMGPIDLSLTGIGTLDATEVSDWATYLEEKGAEESNTADFLTLDGLNYELGNSTYTVTITGAIGDIATTTSTIFINSTYNYNLVGELDDNKSDMFELVLNATYDTKYMDYSNEITLPLTPAKYEMTENITETNNIEVMGYNDPITINPEILDKDSETVTMTLERSRDGSAMASIISGENYYVINGSFDNYEVIVAQGGSGNFPTEVTFSAEDSTDIIGDISLANFTWDFGDGTMGYGMEVEHNFTAVDGDVTVSLNITMAGGNVTTRDILVKVDSQAPTAAISVVTSDTGNVSYAAGVLTIIEDTELVFSGIAFSDEEGMAGETITGSTSVDHVEAADSAGIIEKWFWSWGEENSLDETVTHDGSNNISHRFQEPGSYTVNMIATDVVGHESANATLSIVVKDTTAPIPEFQILDNGTVVTEVVEDVAYVYDASLTLDNIDDAADITFEWIITIENVTTNYTGLTINYTFSSVGEFEVMLFATDTSGNIGNSTKIVHVNLGERPNILMRVGTLAFDPAEGTAGSAMTISVNLSNDGTVNATSILVTFYIRNSDGTDTEIGTTTIASIAAGFVDYEASISWTPGSKGEYSIWANSSCAQEHESQYWDNKIDDFNTQTITIAEASWVMPAIVIGVIAVIIVVFFGFRYFMKGGTESDKSGEKKKKR